MTTTVLTAAMLGMVTASSDLSVAKFLSSHAVLQAEAPTLVGSAPPGHRVSVQVDDERVVSAAATADGLWSVTLPPHAPSNTSDGHTVVVRCPSQAAGAATVITLTDVLFGDVTVYSGQSNMQFSVPEMFDAAAIIAAAQDYPAVRLLTVSDNKSPTPLTDVPSTQDNGWQRPSTASICGGSSPDGVPIANKTYWCEPHCAGCTAPASRDFKRPGWGYFSAVAYIHGVEVYKATGRPQGLVVASWGGSPIQIWTPPAAAAASSCGASVPGPVGQAWNAMVKPLTRVPIKRAVWYQGESNYPATWNATTANGTLAYPCMQRALVTGWRQAWEAVNTHWGNRDFSWAVQQLAAWDEFGPPASGPGLAPFRYAQTTRLPGVGTAVAHDLYDASSPCTSIHPRNKTAMGMRLAAVTLELEDGVLAAAGAPLAAEGPVAVDVQASAAGAVTTIVVTYQRTVYGPVAIRAVAPTNQSAPCGPGLGECQSEFEIGIINAAEASGAAMWRSVPVADVQCGPAAATLKVSVPPGHGLAGLRYAWRSIPRGWLIYDARDLPAPPFIAMGTQLELMPRDGLTPPGPS